MTRDSARILHELAGLAIDTPEIQKELQTAVHLLKGEFAFLSEENASLNNELKELRRLLTFRNK